MLLTRAKSRQSFFWRFLFRFSSEPSPQRHREKLNGIVLVIADGTSLELITAARAYSLGAEGRLALEGFPQTAFVRTYSGSDIVTDSGAAATSMARGIKADNRSSAWQIPSPLIASQHSRSCKSSELVHWRDHG
jgi:alkaline phosphatase